jgi:DNA repair protein RadA/Sms
LREAIDNKNKANLGEENDTGMNQKNNKIYNCTKCGAQFSKWNGRCLECGGWATLEEGYSSTSSEESGLATKAVEPAQIASLAKVESANFTRIVTGISELDRVLGGGLVPGSLVLLAGEPGIGKSTMLAQMTEAVSKNIKDDASEKGDHVKVLYVSGEESAPQVKDRFVRLGCDLEKIYFANETNVEKIQAGVLINNPRLLIIDSIQTMRSSQVPSEAGSINQIRAATAGFLELAKKHNVSVIITGHITKDGQVAGPKSLEHIVDTVIYLEHDQSLHFRLLRSTKNRFGSINEIGIFEMASSGFRQVKNPGAVFMNSSKEEMSGAAVSCVMEGTRPFLVEVQALVTKTVFGYPIRKATGLDNNRLQVLAAVMQKRAGLNLANQDIILNIVGGLKIKETAMDLAICAAIISSLSNQVINKESLFLGEVGLGGEVRNIGKMKERLNEALRLGFKEIYTPNLEIQSKKQTIYKIGNLSDLSRRLLK